MKILPAKVVAATSLDESQARTVVGGLLLIIGASVAALALGYTAQLWLVTVAQVLLILDRINLVALLDEVRDEADVARGKAEAIENHLTGAEPEGDGRHADGKPAVYRNPHRAGPA